MAATTLIVVLLSSLLVTTVVGNGARALRLVNPDDATAVRLLPSATISRVLGICGVLGSLHGGILAAASAAGLAVVEAAVFLATANGQRRPVGVAATVGLAAGWLLAIHLAT